ALGGQFGAGGEGGRVRRLDGDGGAVGAAAHRHLQPVRHRFDVAHGQADVAAPDVGHGGAATVVGGVHVQRVALVEAFHQRLHPVAAVGVGGAGEAPEAALALLEAVAAVAPAVDLQRRVAGVAVAEDRK